MTHEFKNGDSAKYIGRYLPAYYGSIVTVDSDKMYGQIIMPDGKIILIDHYYIRFFDGMKFDPKRKEERICALPTELIPIDDPYEETETTKDELELTT